jgi:hypothetical protein
MLAVTYRWYGGMERGGLGLGFGTDDAFVVCDRDHAAFS